MKKLLIVSKIFSDTKFGCGDKNSMESKKIRFFEAAKLPFCKAGIYNTAKPANLKLELKLANYENVDDPNV